MVALPSLRSSVLHPQPEHFTYLLLICHKPSRECLTIMRNIYLDPVKTFDSLLHPPLLLWSFILHFAILYPLHASSPAGAFSHFSPFSCFLIRICRVLHLEEICLCRRWLHVNRVPWTPHGQTYPKVGTDLTYYAGQMIFLWLFASRRAKANA